MTKREHILSMSVEEAKAAIRRGESRSDFAAVAKLTDEDIRRQATNDPEEREWDWASGTLELPLPKVGIHIKLDADVVAFFKKEGSGYQTRINAALRQFVRHSQKRQA